MKARLISSAVLVIVGVLVMTATASATRFVNGTPGETVTPNLHFVNENGHVVIENPIATISCSWTIEGSIEGHGEATTATGNVATLTVSSCTNSWKAKPVNKGALSFHWTSGHNGVLTWTGMKLHTERFGVTCVYDTNETTIGTVTGGNPMTVKIEASLPVNVSESSALCGSGNHKMRGNLVSTTALYLEP